MTTLTSPLHTGAFPSLADLHTFELAQEADNREAYNQEMDELARRPKRKVKGLPEGIDMRHLETIRPDPALIPWKERTKEEQEYLDESAFGLRAHGKTFRQIGAHFGFSPSTGHAMVKRHLYRQRKELSEHLADIRDYELLLLNEMLPPHIDKAKNGDPRALALVLDSLRLKLRLLMFSNPTVDEELSAKLDVSRQLAKGYDEAVFEREEENTVHAPREEGITGRVMDTVEPSVEDRTDCEQVRTNSEQRSEQNTQSVAKPAVAAEGTFSSEQATGIGSAINVVLVLILLAVCQVGLACRAWPGYTSRYTIQNLDDGSAPHVTCELEHRQACVTKADSDGAGLVPDDKAQLTSSRYPGTFRQKEPTVGLACRAWPGYTDRGDIQNQDQGSAPHVTPVLDRAQQPKKTCHRGRHSLPTFIRSSHPFTTQATPGRRGLLDASPCQPARNLQPYDLQPHSTRDFC